MAEVVEDLMAACRWEELVAKGKLKREGIGIYTTVNVP
jgi:hypothetical protein